MKKLIYLSLAVGILTGSYYLLSNKFSGLTVTQDTRIPALVKETQTAPGLATSTEGSDEIIKVERREVPTGFKEYKNQAYHFSLLYPAELSVKFYDEGGGQATIVFQNVEKFEGFQIFITPYEEKQISNARFMKDEPSGVRLMPMEVKIDGVEATSFYGKDSVIGDTAEIWFINNSYLYEASTPKSQVNWFGNVMQTFKFE